MILLDTCVLIWLAVKPQELSAPARRAMEKHSTGLCVSAITAFELGLLVTKKRLVLPFAPGVWYQEVLEQHGVQELPVSGLIAGHAAVLPAIHGDPCDRMIVATALQNRLTVVSPDRRFTDYKGLTLVW